jgi:diacylglycerol kinase family enzyme
MTKQAVAEQVDLVIGAGGDGTIRYVADGLAHTGIPLGLVPAGTGNLLARNLPRHSRNEPPAEVTGFILVHNDLHSPANH